MLLSHVYRFMETGHPVSLSATRLLHKCQNDHCISTRHVQWATVASTLHCKPATSSTYRFIPFSLLGWKFEAVIMVVILANVVTLAMYDPLTAIDIGRNAVLQVRTCIGFIFLEIICANSIFFYTRFHSALNNEHSIRCRVCAMAVRTALSAHANLSPSI